MTMAGVLLGTQIYQARGETAARQARALASWRELPDVELANLQFHDDIVECAGFSTLPLLRLDSRAVTGRAGLRKPIASEVFSVLATRAQERGCRVFAFFNSDVQVLPQAIQTIEERQWDVCLFSRMDVDAATRRHVGIELAGVDGFAVRVEWWARERRRFRGYVIGEPAWDNVYCAQMLCHGRGRLLNRSALLLHEQHPTAWTASSFADYTRFLSALDAPYFTLWYEYWSRLQPLRRGGASEAEELALQAEVFVWRPSVRNRLTQLGRVVKAHVRYRHRRRRPDMTGTSHPGW